MSTQCRDILKLFEEKSDGESLYTTTELKQQLSPKWRKETKMEIHYLSMSSFDTYLVQTMWQGIVHVPPFMTLILLKKVRIYPIETARNYYQEQGCVSMTRLCSSPHILF